MGSVVAKRWWGGYGQNGELLLLNNDGCVKKVQIVLKGDVLWAHGYMEIDVAYLGKGVLNSWVEGRPFVVWPDWSVVWESR